ncbi:MAG: argininosuccinate lyase [Candidatus Obscuribacterales bacterium]|jgi:argininosuccinate lyase
MQVLRKAFTQQLDQSVTAFVNSVDADQALVEVDIQGSIAHATMLCQQGLLTEAQGANIVAGLKLILAEYQEGKFTLNPVFEDVHMNVEKRLEQLIGQDALRLHTARSRNDQVALDLRLFVLAQIALHKTQISVLKSAIAKCALENIEAVMPGYTHLQRAQPVLFAHAMHAFMEMFERDFGRFSDLEKRTAVSPLGAGAQAGTGLPIDPHLSAKLLGMPACFNNSIDAVSDRDFVAEYVFAASMCSVHLSQMAETFVIWATREFGFVTFSDAVTTASSLMPQKKNPDPVEIVRGKAGGMMGELINILSTLKGLPLGYNRDLQETKPPAIKVSKELAGCLNVMAVAVNSMTVNSATTLKAASDPDMITTDLVEYLVNKAVPFRKAHEEVSALVAFSREKNVPLSTLTLEEMQGFSKEYTEDALALFDPVVSVKAKTSHGSTGTAKVKAVIELFPGF